MQFYSYMWLREDGTPYYVGKGCGRRAFHTSHGVHRPADKFRVLIFPQLSEADAFESEIELIKLFGRKDNGTGILRNLTDGGEGVAGRTYQHTKETKSKIAAAHRANWKNPKYRAVFGLFLFKGRRHTAESNAKNSKSHFGKKQSSDTKAKRSAAMLGFRHSEETKEKLRHPKSPEHRAHMAVSAKARELRRFIKTVAWG